MLIIEDCKNTTAVTVLVRGGNKMIVEEVCICVMCRSIAGSLYIVFRMFSNTIFDPISCTSHRQSALFTMQCQ